MIQKLILIAAACAIGACSNLTPQQKQAITTAEKLAGALANVYGTYEAANGKTAAANDAYAVGALMTAYGSQPVPTDIVQATVLLPQSAAILAPLATKNTVQSKAIVTAAAAIASAVAPPALSGTNIAQATP